MPSRVTADQPQKFRQSHVRDGSYATTNYGTATTFQVKNVNSTGTGYDRVGLLKYSLSGVTPSAVSRAILWLNGNVEDSGGNQTTVTAYGLSSDTWTETGVTWNSAPSTTTAHGTGEISNTYDWVGLDVTALVQAATDGTAAIGVWQQAVQREDAHGDRQVYVSVECECAWEPEHGLQIVFRRGSSVSKVGPFDSHLTNVSAFDRADLADVVYHRFG